VPFTVCLETVLIATVTGSLYLGLLLNVSFATATCCEIDTFAGCSFFSGTAFETAEAVLALLKGATFGALKVTF
jgi:hypothetical protein